MAWPLIIGAGLIAGGAVMGGLAQQSRRRALGRLGSQAMSEYEGLADKYTDLFKPIMEQYSLERKSNIDLYRTEMERARTDFTNYFDQARQQYGEGMDKALSELRTGRESTIALQRQQTQRSQQRAASANAFTGLGQTSFGQQRLEAIGNQGVLQEGAIREQYAGQLSSMEAARAQGLSTMSAQMGQGLSGIQQSMATNLSNIYQTYAGNIANMQSSGLSNRFNILQTGYQTAFQARTQAAGLAGAMTGAFGSALGSIGGAVFGAGLGGPAGGGNAGAGAGSGGGGWGNFNFGGSTQAPSNMYFQPNQTLQNQMMNPWGQ